MILRKFCFIFAFVFLSFLSLSSSIFATPSYTYTGSSTLVNDGNGNYRLKFLTSGTFTPGKDMLIDAFLVGGGGSGYTWYGNTGAGGGGGGYTKTQKTINLTGSTAYSIVIGAGGNGTSGGTTTAFGNSAAGGAGGGSSSNGGAGGSGGGAHVSAGGVDGAKGGDWLAGPAYGGAGQGTTTREFGEPTGTLYSTGGAGNPGGCDYASGGANTGNGGMGAWWDCGYYGYGGSGIVVIRFYDDTTAPSGGSISYSATTITSSTQSFSITVADGTDTGTGINTSSRKLFRQEATLTSGSCGAFGTAVQVTYSGTYPNITSSNFVANRCYKYQWSVSDNVGNNVIYSSSTVITSSASVIGIKDVALGSFVSINGLNFIKVNSTGLLVAAAEYATDFTQTFSYTGAAQTFTVPYSGWYQIEAWGAQGGSNVGTEGSVAGNVGGGGGYTSGKVYLNKNETLYLYVGGQGNHATSINNVASKGYNGGGMAGYEAGCGTSCMKGAGGGGGATDIRLISDNLNSRIMTAGGGGGAANWSLPKVGGAGGTLIGANGQEYNAGGYSYTNSTGGTQITGGAGAVGLRAGGAGIFGIGGNADYTTLVYGGGGGGGYYGGGGGSVNSSVVGSGAGGSSFISGYAGVNAITSSSSTTATYTTLHYSGKYFLAGQMQSGVRSGNGQAIITLIPAPTRLNTNLNNVRYIKDCVNGNSTDITASWVEVQAIVNGVNVAKGKTVTGTVAQNSSYPYSRIVDGDITTANYAMASANNSQCITIDLGQVYNLDEVGIWHYWGDGRTVYRNITSASADNSNWRVLLFTTEPETANGKRVNAHTAYTFTRDLYYTYTGGEQTFNIQQSGTYKLEVWGAQGGGSGGYGAYSTGTVNLSAGSILYVYVGGTTQTGTGGYNGGGSITGNVYGGGGATHISTSSGLLTTLSANQSAILIVAGGGGGKGNGYAGGAGGGVSGVNGTGEDFGYGGTQTAGGGVTNTGCGANIGIFGKGGSASWVSEGIGGGGGGFYGGGSGGGCGNNGAGGGGSGYIGNSNLSNKYMYCYNCTTSSDTSTLTYTTTNVSSTATSNYAKSGDGYARISFVE